MQFFGFMRFSGWTCKSNRYFRNFFTLLQQRTSKAYAINCSCFPTGAQNTLYKQKRKNELKNKSSTTTFPCYSEFTCAILSISSISRLTIAYMWSIGVGAVCILVTRVVSFTLVNVYEIIDKKLCKIAVHKPIGSLSKPRRRRQRERHQTKGLMSRTMAMHVRYKSLYISLPSSAKQQREMTKFCVLYGTWTTTANISYFHLELHAAIAHLARARF